MSLTPRGNWKSPFLDIFNHLYINGDFPVGISRQITMHPASPVTLNRATELCEFPVAAARQGAQQHQAGVQLQLVAGPPWDVRHLGMFNFNEINI